jgi:hypothetical protein
MKNVISGVLAFAAMLGSTEAFSAVAITNAVPIKVFAQDNGVVVIYVGSAGPNVCGGTQGDFVIPATVSDAARSRMLSLALAARASQSSLAIYYDGTCEGGRHITSLVGM